MVNTWLLDGALKSPEITVPTPVQSMAEVQLTLVIDARESLGPAPVTSAGVPQVPDNASVTMNGLLLPTSMPTAVQSVADVQLTALKSPDPPVGLTSIGVPQVPAEPVTAIGWLSVASNPTAVQFAGSPGTVAAVQLTLVKLPLVGPDPGGVTLVNVQMAEVSVAANGRRSPSPDPTAVQSVGEVQLTAAKVPEPPGGLTSMGVPQPADVSVTVNGQPLPSLPTAVQSVAEVQLTPVRLPSPLGGVISVRGPQPAEVSVAYAAFKPSFPTAVQSVAEVQLTLLKVPAPCCEPISVGVPQVAVAPPVGAVAPAVPDPTVVTPAPIEAVMAKTTKNQRDCLLQRFIAMPFRNVRNAVSRYSAPTKQGDRRMSAPDEQAKIRSLRVQLHGVHERHGV